MSKMKSLPPLDLRNNINHAPHVFILGAGASLAELKKAVERRHDIVHRNGKTTEGKLIEVTMDDVAKLIEVVDATIKYIDKQVKDGFLDDDEVSE